MNDYQFTHADLSGLHYRKGVNAKSAPLPFTPQDGAEFEAWDPETRTLSYSLPPLEDGDERDIIDVVITQEQIAAGPQDAPAPVPQIVSKAQLDAREVTLIRQIKAKPEGYATMTTIKTTGVSMVVKQSGATGVCYSINGGTPTYVAGAVSVNVALSGIVDPDGSPTEIAVWPAISATSGRVGDLTYLSCDNNNLTTLDVSGLTALTFLGCYNNSLTTLDVSGLTALTSFDCSGNNLTTLDVSGLTALTSFNCSGNPNLAEVTAVGFAGANPYGTTHYNANFTGCGLTTDAVWSMLDQCANATDNPCFIQLVGNPCDKNDGVTTPEAMTDGDTYTESDVQTLLNAKGYSLVLSDATLAPA